jgi:tetratricopeptide (TPR) repeat protein
MSNPVAELLQRLAGTQGDTHAQSVLAAKFALALRPEEERASLRAAMDAASILRWFDHSLLARVLDISEEASRRQFEILKQLPFVERYRRREEDLRNLHESTRLGWRKELARETTERFRHLSARAVACFVDDLTPAGRIEWIYHLLCGDPDQGARELQAMDRDWSTRARIEDLSGLASSLKELEETGLVQNPGRIWVLLSIAWTRVNRGEAAELAEAALAVLKLARDLGETRAEADSQCLLGDVLRAQGKLAQAQSAYEENLAISGRLAAGDPDNLGWQRELALAHTRVGIVLEIQGSLAESLVEHHQALVISRRLTEQDPANAARQGELAQTYYWIGSALESEGRLTEALAAFEEYRAIYQALAAQDPDNAGSQRELATAQNRLGEVLQAQANPVEAEAAYRFALEILARLAARDPSNADWQRELAGSLVRIGSVLKDQGDLVGAQAAHERSQAIFRKLATQNPRNAFWLSDLAISCGNVGSVLQARGQLAEAKAALAECLSMSLRLAEQDPANGRWQRELAAAYGSIAGLESNAGNYQIALRSYEKASQILGELAEKAPDFAQWIEDKKRIDSALADCRELALKAELPDAPA